ncbi:putative membrane protein YkoI [Scopulibacillus darangshiensis]|uniref:Putative membrane protein YkoI n=1 Tax=Scopulibacillus darangshiensis TaxID=442528 RepID=A0A4R2ND75_9BACL|nr:PepSY domain-containing protein [Scopulibacillus darangshiensis]TCP19127.1 putative membrane protein YkoI [Scopulibacillus darangshiensis]
MRFNKKQIITTVTAVALATGIGSAAITANAANSQSPGHSQHVVSEHQTKGSATVSMKDAIAKAKKEANGTVTGLELDKEDGQLAYEIDIQGTTHSYEVIINADNGDMIKVEKDQLDDDLPADVKTKINLIDAAGIASEKVNSPVTDIELDQYKGALTFEAEEQHNGKVTEIKVDANSGEIVSLHTKPKDEDDD